jgi:hypothetical protein
MAQPDGRIRALYAAASAGLETASFLVRAVWIVCVVVLAFFVVTFAAAAVDAIF